MESIGMLLRNILWILILIYQVTTQENKEEEEKFIPTNKWQVVKKGQHIPKGLHVRINFETGVTEAKLLEEDNQKNNNNALLEVPQENNDEELLKPEVIEEKLRKIKGDDILNVDEIKNIKEKYRSYDDIKKEMSALNLTPKIDAEILKDLFEQYKDELKNDKINVHTILKILEDLDFLAHQFDNALEFVRQNGFQEIIYKNLNLSNSEVRGESLKLFGSLVQNNGKVQIHALETGSISILLRILDTEQSVDVKSKGTYALSCLLRRFPLAQLRFVENGGISVITKILEKEPTTKIQIKLITLMNDLLIENIQAFQDEPNENQNMVISQYKLVNLENILLKHGWCEYLNKLLFSLIAADPDDHDSIEKALVPMHTIADKCVGQYNNEILVSLQERYKTLALNEMDRSDEFSNNDFFTNLYDLCLDMLRHNNIKTEL